MAHSAGYALHTGRGLVWIACRDGEVALVLRHPNVVNAMLVLPAGAELAVFLWSDLCAHFIAQSWEVTLGRVTPELYATTENHCSFEVIAEQVLDWKYPVRIIDTVWTSEASGGKFKKFREQVKKAKRVGEINVIDQFDHLFQTAAVQDGAKALITRWAEQTALSEDEEKTFDTHHLESGNLAALDVALMRVPRMKYLVFLCNGRVVGLELIELADGPIANGIAKCRCPAHPGISVFMEREVSSQLLKMGYKERNINGSETQTLDEYRLTTLRPDENKSIRLSTFQFSEIEAIQ